MPDLLDTMKIVLAEIDLALERLHLRRIGGIEHEHFGEAGDLPKVFFRTSGHRLDPPIPSNRACVKPALNFGGETSQVLACAPADLR